jgi:hypothetical protein
MSLYIKGRGGAPLSIAHRIPYSLLGAVYGR